jgi:catechol 2,3-dioxygenase-like lactoylglutathione lyase family enzyme
MNLRKIKETCLYVNNLVEAKRFYHEILELPLISYIPGKHLFLRVGESVLLLFNPEDSKLKLSPPAHFGGGEQHFAFEINDEEYETAKQEIKSKGIKIIDEVLWQSGKKSFYFKDPAGNVLEIIPASGMWD